jgi:CheY-like chemotaxis protein
MIDDARATFYAALHNNKQTLNTYISANIPSLLLGDEIRIKQILINLLGNAVKFTPEYGTISVKLNGQFDAQSRRFCLELTVSDTGIGITEEQKQSLFSPFSQADTSTTREFGGTGLGLDISRQLAEMMGGGIQLNSALGQGSTFIVSLKLGIEQKDAVVGDRLKMTVNLKPLALNILVAEDDPTNQKVIRAMLNRLGHHSQIVDTGALVEGALKLQTFDVVMMDYHMPEMDGIEATRLLRSKSEYKDLPVVALTAATSTEERDDCREAGMNDFLSKPYTLDALSKVLIKAVNK